MMIRDIHLNDLRDLAETTVTVAACYQAGVFRALAEGPADAARVAERAGLDRRAVAIALPALEDMGLLERDGEGAYRPTPECRDKLCDPDSDAFIGGGLPHWLRNLRGWTRLDEVLRSGEPLPGGGDERDEADLRRFMSAMAAAPEERVRRIVRACLERRPDARTVLDLGGGPGHMSRAFVDEGLRATLFDTPRTVDFVRSEYGLDDVTELELVGGDFTTDPLPEGPFDVVLMSNIVHIYGPEQNRALVEKVGRVTAPGGVAAIGDFVRGRSPRAARFALVMLMHTERGDAYAEDDMRTWLEAAGFGDVRVDDVDDDRQLVTGVKGVT